MINPLPRTTLMPLTKSDNKEQSLANEEKNRDPIRWEKCYSKLEVRKRTGVYSQKKEVKIASWGFYLYYSSGFNMVLLPFIFLPILTKDRYYYFEVNSGTITWELPAMSKSPSEMRQVCMYANFDPPKSSEEMMMNSMINSTSNNVTNTSSTKTTIGSGAVVRKRVSFHEDVKPSKDSFNDLYDSDEKKNKSESNEILAMQTTSECSNCSTILATHHRVLFIMLLTTGIGIGLWKRIQQNRRLVDSNNTKTIHTPLTIPKAVDEQYKYEDPKDFKSFLLQDSREEVQDRYLRATVEIPTTNYTKNFDEKNVSVTLTPSNIYNEETVLQPSLQDLVFPNKSGLNISNADYLISQHLSESDGGRIGNIQNEDVLLLQTKDWMKIESKENFISHKCSIKCLLTFSFLNNRADCQGCTPNKHFNWTEALDTLFID